MIMCLGENMLWTAHGYWLLARLVADVCYSPRADGLVGNSLEDARNAVTITQLL